MLRILTATLLSFLFIGIVLAAAFIFTDFDYALTALFAPKYEAVRRDVMLSSRIYQEGETRTLYNYQRQFAAGDDTTRKIIAAAARHELATLDHSRLPVDLQAFASQVEAY